MNQKNRKPVVAASTLLQEIRELIFMARTWAVRSVNSIQVTAYFEIGRRIVEEEQNGSMRAKYGKGLLSELSAHLTADFGRGYSVDNLENMRRFYRAYKGKSIKSETMPRESISIRYPQKSETASRISKGIVSGTPFKLSWSHYLCLLQIRGEGERCFYEIEAINNNWSLRELKRQIRSGLFERLSLSRDKKKIKELSLRGQLISQPQDVIKDPYVLEFLGLKEEDVYSETELERAIIDKLEHFLLELGKGYLFEARQKRFTFDEEHFFVDLVFFNRLLRCYVLIDLKMDKLTHQDLGQMQMYVNYFDRCVKRKDENPTVGILLCKNKKKAIVELTLPSQANIFAAEYQLYLPDKEQLRQKLIEWQSDAE